MKKKCGCSGFFSATSTNHGVATAKNSSKPLTRCRRDQIAQSRAASVYSTSTAPGSTRPIKPLDSTASAMPAQHTSIQLRRSLAAASSRWAISSAHKHTVIMPDKPMSSESIWPEATQNRLEPSTRPAYKPARPPNRRLPACAVSTTPSRPHRPVHKRACHSPRPKAVKESAFIQVCSGGFSKYLMPFRRVVTQSPLVNISRAISA